MSLSREGQRIQDELEKAINDAFGDTSVSAEETLEIMLSAKGDIELCIAAVREDIGAEP